MSKLAELEHCDDLGVFFCLFEGFLDLFAGRGVGFWWQTIMTLQLEVKIWCITSKALLLQRKILIAVLALHSWQSLRFHIKYSSLLDQKSTKWNQATSLHEWSLELWKGRKLMICFCLPLQQVFHPVLVYIINNDVTNWRSFAGNWPFNIPVSRNVVIQILPLCSWIFRVIFLHSSFSSSFRALWRSNLHNWWWAIFSGNDQVIYY